MWFDLRVAISDGDPRTLVPELFGQLTWPERNQAIRFYSLRHASIGRGNERYPDDEAPASVARRAMVLGTYAAIYVVALVPMFGLIAWNLIVGPSGTASVVGWVLTGVAALLAALLGGLRHRQINRYFGRHFPGSLDYRAGTNG